MHYNTTPNSKGHTLGQLLGEYYRVAVARASRLRR